MIERIRKSYFVKFVSLFLATQMLLPMQTFALTGGPTQPEFAKFTPMGVDNMVNLFTGDFQYNIPLLEVDGYPINISYSSGIGMEDQASMVGLGWTLNAGGIINRAVRGIPDDFEGTTEKIQTVTNMAPNWTAGVNSALALEVAGCEFLGLNIGQSVSYNNYNGFGLERSVGISLSGGSKATGMGACANLGITSSTENGITISPSVSFSQQIGKKMQGDQSPFGGSVSLGASYNSRAGLRQVSINAGVESNIDHYANMVMSKSGLNGVSSVIPIGTTSYVPQITNAMQSFSLAFELGFGAEVFWLNGKAKIGASYSVQKLKSPYKSSPAYGYIYSDRGNSDVNAMHDFNREKDGSYSKTTPALPMTQMTYDIYSVSCQDLSGMFRPFRDFNLVYDPLVVSSSGDGNAGADLGAGNVLKGGANLSGNLTTSSSGRWSNNEVYFRNYAFNSSEKNSKYEHIYFKNAGEFSTIDNNYYEQIHGTEPLLIPVDSEGKSSAYFVSKKASSNNNYMMSPDPKRSSRDKRNLNFSYLTAEEASVSGLEKKNNYYELDVNGNYTFVSKNRYGMEGRQKHHISEITVNRPDGARYVFGSQTYNYNQKEVTFNVSPTAERANGMVKYSGNDDTPSNDNGVDKYFNESTLPAHATAYQLTAVLSPDYVDVTGDGLSSDDLGGYTKFTYVSTNNQGNPYKWRNPYDKGWANLQEGSLAQVSDDKGSYIYGEKEIKYINSIESKNHVAYFYYSRRFDACPVIDKQGGCKNEINSSLMQLDSICLYSKYDEQGKLIKVDNKNKTTQTPIQTVHFKYDYFLCKNVLSSTKYDVTKSDNPDPKSGKLTLTEIKFSYGNSDKAKLSPYRFSYNENKDVENPNYTTHACDRWGNYKSWNENNIINPYVSQEKKLDQMFTRQMNMHLFGI